MKDEDTILIAAAIIFAGLLPGNGANAETRMAALKHAVAMARVLENDPETIDE